MAKNLGYIMRTLIERNRGKVGKEELFAAFKEQALADPDLKEAILLEFVDLAYPLAKKIAVGEPLTKDERKLATELGL